MKLSSLFSFFEKKNNQQSPPHSRELPYSRGSILGCPIAEGRDLQEYMLNFNINLDELNTKAILDLGAGLHNRFAEELKKSGICARVVALSPDYSEKRFATVTRKESPTGMLVAGLGQKLPFADESFDTIYALHLNEWLRSEEDLFLILSEMARTLKREGVGKFGPFYDVPEYSYPFRKYSTSQDLTKSLQGHGATLAKEDVSNTIGTVKVKDEWANAFYVRGYNFVVKKD